MRGECREQDGLLVMKFADLISVQLLPCGVCGISCCVNRSVEVSGERGCCCLLAAAAVIAAVVPMRFAAGPFHPLSRNGLDVY